MILFLVIIAAIAMAVIVTLYDESIIGDSILGLFVIIFGLLGVIIQIAIIIAIVKIVYWALFEI